MIKQRWRRTKKNLCIVCKKKIKYIHLLNDFNTCSNECDNNVSNKYFDSKRFKLDGSVYVLELD